MSAVSCCLALLQTIRAACAAALFDGHRSCCLTLVLGAASDLCCLTAHLVLHGLSRQCSAGRRPVSSCSQVSSWPAGKLFLGARLASTSSLQVNALALAGYAGLTVNAINLIPMGELDGARVAFGLWGRRCDSLSNLAVASCLVEAVTEGRAVVGRWGHSWLRQQQGLV